jgi:hypothetical protein
MLGAFEAVKYISTAPQWASDTTCRSTYVPLRSTIDVRIGPRVSTCVTLKSAANFAIAFVGSGSLVVRTKPASLHPVDLKSPLPPSLSVPNRVLGQAVGLIVERSLREPQQFIQQVTEPRHLFREPYLSLFDRKRSG